MPISNIDHTIFHFINSSCANPVLDAICPIARDKNTWIPFYIMGGVLVLYKYRWQGLWMVVCAALAILASDQASNLIKHFIHRLRPCAVENVRLLLPHCSPGFSFTCNHAANHFAIAVFLSLAFRRIRWFPYVLVFWAGFIALSQVYVGVHYPADIAGGALLGSLVGWIAFITFKFGNKFIAKT
jgi:membrane-associated phospholipid phosphatase